MNNYHDLLTNIAKEFSSLKVINLAGNESTFEVDNRELCSLLRKLRDDNKFSFETLIDLCGVDYAHYGKDEWQTLDVTSEGFSRGVSAMEDNNYERRFAVVYHLLSIKYNRRLRIRCYAEGAMPIINSVVEIWNNANWYEREAFDLFGILFDGHPDLRRLLTDYGFIGHPFRKDFPLSGNVEVKYDEQEGRVVYQPVSIEPRVLVPKVIRKDSRYLNSSEVGKK